MHPAVTILLVLIILAGLGTGAYFLAKYYRKSDSDYPSDTTGPGISVVTYFDSTIGGNAVTFVFQPGVGPSQIKSTPHGLIYIKNGDTVLPIGSYKLIHVSKQAGLVTYGITPSAHTLKSLGTKGDAQDVLLTKKKVVITTTAGEEIVLKKRRTKL